MEFTEELVKLRENHPMGLSRSRFRCKTEDLWTNIVFKNLKLEGWFSQKIDTNDANTCSSVREPPDNALVVLFFQGGRVSERV